MHKLLTAAVVALFVGVFAGTLQATPLSASGALATSPAFQQSLPDAGVTKVFWRHGWYHRGWRHYGWHHRPWHRFGWYHRPWRRFGWGWHRPFAFGAIGFCRWPGCF
jgi:hypothetical protein